MLQWNRSIKLIPAFQGVVSQNLPKFNILTFVFTFFFRCLSQNNVHHLLNQSLTSKFSRKVLLNKFGSNIIDVWIKRSILFILEPVHNLWDSLATPLQVNRKTNKIKKKETCISLQMTLDLHSPTPCVTFYGTCVVPENIYRETLIL